MLCSTISVKHSIFFLYDYSIVNCRQHFQFLKNPFSLFYAAQILSAVPTHASGTFDDLPLMFSLPNEIHIITAPLFGAFKPNSGAFYGFCLSVITLPVEVSGFGGRVGGCRHLPILGYQRGRNNILCNESNNLKERRLINFFVHSLFSFRA